MSKWIPCSERLPEKDGEYFVTARWLGKKEVREVWIDHFQFGCQWDDFDNNGSEVLAWMPLPEPWEGEDE